ncbi:MAG: hypothetical protein AB8B72_00970 [Crocinitomicaceae bacterium]
MKKVNYLFLCLMISFVSEVQGQNIKISNGSQFKVTSLESIENTLHIGRSHSSFLTKAGLLGRKFRVLNLDENLDIKSKFEIEIPKIEKKKVRYEWSNTVDDKVYFLSNYFDRKANSYTLFASELEVSTGKFNKHFEVLKVVDDKFKSGLSPFKMVRSVDSTKILIITEYPTKNRENARYGLTVVKKNLGKIWEKDIEFPERDKDFSLIDYEVDMDGNIHFVASIRMSRDEKKEKDAKSRYYSKVYSYYHAESELKEHEISFQDLIIDNLDLDVNDKNELLGTGFYSEKFMSTGYKGFFFLKIDPTTKTIAAKNVSEFSPDLIKQLYNNKRQGERKAKKGKFPPYIIRASIALKNGGYAVVAEHYVYTISQTTSANGNTQTRESWLFGNVVVMFLNGDGKMETASVLKKRQYCTAVNGASSLLQQLGISPVPGINELAYYGISVLQNNSNIYVLYNENPKNEARVQEGKTPKSVRQRTSVTMLNTFKPDGKINGDVLFKSKDRSAGIKMPLMPRSYIQYANNEAIVFGRLGKKMRATRISID